MTKRKSPYSTDALFRGLKTLLASLPSEQEKSELLRTLHEAQRFVEEIQLLVEAIPTIESSRELSEGLSRLDILAERARTDAGLRRLLGLRGSTTSKAGGTANNGDIDTRACRLERELSQLETSDIAAVLEQSGEPLSVLTRLATRRGMRTRSKERKSDLVKRVATHIKNQRGYRLLRGEGQDSTR